jgi:hypothetical protein
MILVGSGGIWWDLVGSGGIWWDLVGGGIWWWDHLIPPDPGNWWDLWWNHLITPHPTNGSVVVEFCGINEILLKRADRAARARTQRSW